MASMTQTPRFRPSPVDSVRSGPDPRRTAPTNGTRPADSVRPVDVRIGVTQAPRELNIELPDDSDRGKLKAKVEAALTGASDVLWLVDKRGKDVGIPSAKIAYIELGSSDGDRRIGFGG